jgi:UDP-N-acetyl-D-galactosamine dehydrogenase
MPRFDLTWQRVPLALPYAYLAREPQLGSYDGIVIAVGHREFVDFGTERTRRFGKPSVVLYDVKGIFPRHETDWRL